MVGSTHYYAYSAVWSHSFGTEGRIYIGQQVEYSRPEARGT